MSLLAWIFLGLVAGFFASMLVNRRGEGIALDIVLGVVGAVVGGFVFSALGSTGVTGFNVWSMFVATLGAVITLVLAHAILRRRV